MRKTKTLSLDESTFDLLSHQENHGRYIDGIVQRSWRRTSFALQHLLSHGLDHNEILECMSALNSVWEIVEDPQLHYSSIARHKPASVHFVRWNDIQSLVCRVPSVAFAIDILASEYWCGNTYLRKILEQKTEAEA